MMQPEKIDVAAPEAENAEDPQECPHCGELYYDDFHMCRDTQESNEGEDWLGGFAPNH
jgi:hypothetical protein